MKKLLTLFALLAMYLSASAIVVVDKEVNFSTYPDGPSTLTAWGGGDRLSFQNGYLHYHGEEATANPWDVQFFPISGLTVDVDQLYKVELKIRGSVAGPIFNMKFGGVDRYGVFDLVGNDEWQVIELEYTATSTDGSVLFQCGSYVGDWDMEYMKISHEERDQKPVEWKNVIENGDAEGEFGEVPCVQTKSWNSDPELAAVISPSEIVTEDDGNKAFVCHSKAVNPPLTWDEDGEQWGTPHSAGDPMPDNAWQNQLWLTFPRQMRDGEQVKISFRYRASKAVRVDTQNHRAPGDYLGGSSIEGTFNFTEAWQTYEKTFSTVAEMQSIAFNLGAEVYDEDIDFFIDDFTLSEMVLEEGFFVAAINTADEYSIYDYENATKFEWSEDDFAYVATVGTKGDQSSWVNELMISTVRGNDKAFLSNCLKLEKPAVDNPEAWTKYSVASKAKIKLPAAGVWTIMIDDEYHQMNFVKVEGDEEKEPITIVPNPTEVVVNAVERDWKSNGSEEETGAGEEWDNQFFIIGNRVLATGEEIVLAFDYKAETPATVNTQNSEGAGGYLHWAGIGSLSFTDEYQHYEETLVIPSDAQGKQNSWTFNLAVMKGANKYYFKNIVFKTADDTETLIDMEGTSSFFVKEGANTTAHEFGTETGINNVANKTVSTVSYNLAGQRVANNYKGIVIKNGSKYIVK